MKNRYEALLVLDTKGREENVKDMIERLEGEFQKEGAKVEQVQKMDKRQFSYAAGALDSGFFVNFIFEGEPQVVDKLRAKFKLDAEIYRQHYQKLHVKKAKKEKVAKSK
jgi:small subunit ribosomal protein S6